ADQIEGDRRRIGSRTLERFLCRGGDDVLRVLADGGGFVRGEYLAVDQLALELHDRVHLFLLGELFGTPVLALVVLVRVRVRTRDRRVDQPGTLAGAHTLDRLLALA